MGVGRRNCIVQGTHTTVRVVSSGGLGVSIDGGWIVDEPVSRGHGLVQRCGGLWETDRKVENRAVDGSFPMKRKFVHPVMLEEAVCSVAKVGAMRHSVVTQRALDTWGSTIEGSMIGRGHAHIHKPHDQALATYPDATN